MSFNMDDIVKEQLDSMTNMDEDWLIQAFDIDEDAVIEFKKAIKHWIKTDLGKKKARSEFTEKRTGSFGSRKSARVVKGGFGG